MFKMVVTLLHSTAGKPQTDIWTNVGLYRSGLLASKTCVQTGHHARPANLSWFHIVSYCFYMTWLAKSCHGSFCCWGCFPSSRLGVVRAAEIWISLGSVASLHTHTLLEAVHPSHVLVKKKNMLFHTVYTLYCYINKKTTKDLPIILGSMFIRKLSRISVLKGTWNSSKLLFLIPTRLTGFPIRHCSFVIQGKKHLGFHCFAKVWARICWAQSVK